MATIQAGRGLTGRSKELRAALASMQSAHRLLVAEAAALRQFLPEVRVAPGAALTLSPNAQSPRLFPNCRVNTNTPMM